MRFKHCLKSSIMKSIAFTKAYSFAINIFGMYKKLTVTRKEFILSKQCVRSGTAIGALLSEAEHAQSKADFLSKVSIALKESNETQYWLNLLRDTGYLTAEEHAPLYDAAAELTKILASTVKTTKQNLSK